MVCGLLPENMCEMHSKMDLLGGGHGGGEEQGAHGARLHMQAADGGSRAQPLQLYAPLTLPVQVPSHLPQRPGMKCDTRKVSHARASHS